MKTKQKSITLAWDDEEIESKNGFDFPQLVVEELTRNFSLKVEFSSESIPIVIGTIPKAKYKEALKFLKEKHSNKIELAPFY